MLEGFEKDEDKDKNMGIVPCLHFNVVCHFHRNSGIQQSETNLKHIGEMTTQTLQPIDSNLELMIDHVNQDTYAVFWSKMFQDTLEEISKGNLTVKTRTELQDCLTNIMLAGDYISSIVFYDNIGNSFMCNREEVVLKKEIAVEDAYWYEKAIKKDGDWIFETDGGGIVSYKSKNRNILSMTV